MKKRAYKTNESLYLKTRLSSYPYLEDMIIKCENKIEEAMVKMLGIKSPSNFPPVPNDGGSSVNMIIEYGEEKEKWEKRLKKYQGELKELEDIVDLIDDEMERAFIRDVYKVGLSNNRLSYKYHCTENHIYKKINGILEKITQKI